MARKTISLLGATGSIGTQLCDIIARHEDAYELVALGANRDVERLLYLAKKFRPRLVAINDADAYTQLRAGLAKEPIEVLCGAEGQIAAASCGADMVLVAIVGLAGLRPAWAAARHSAQLALANKECLVSAGALFMRHAKKVGCTVLPVDSEHNGIFQLLRDRAEPAAQIILTATGGPFLKTGRRALAHITPKMATQHPVWRMGAKISVDSATLMNKGLELIEAQHFFGLTPEQLRVVIHPQAYVHAMVGYRDGSYFAQLAMPDMRLPLAYCLAYPQRFAHNFAPLDWEKMHRLEFLPPDREQFPALALAEQAMAAGPVACLALNAANEETVAAFLAGKLRFTDIAYCNATVLDLMGKRSYRLAGVDDVLKCDTAVRRCAQQQIQKQMTCKSV